MTKIRLNETTVQLEQKNNEVAMLRSQSRDINSAAIEKVRKWKKKSLSPGKIAKK